MENIEQSSPLRITPTVRALSSALRGKRENVPDSSREHGDRIFPEPEKLWFKESSAKNLRNRDFLSPTTMLNTLYADGQVRAGWLTRVCLFCLADDGVMWVRQTRTAAARLYTTSGCFSSIIQVNLPPYEIMPIRPILLCHTVLEKVLSLRGSGILPVAGGEVMAQQPTPDTLTLGQLRTVLLADHMGALLRRQGFAVSYCPTLPEDSDIIAFLRALGIDWPTTPANWTNEEREEKIQEALENSVEEEKEGALRVNLKRVFQEEGLLGYDPSLGTCTVHRDSVSHLAQLDLATADCTVAMATTLHVTSCQDEFRQQQIAVLWRASGATHTQRHLVCGPVKTPGSHLTAAQYLQLRRGQMKEASEMKYGDQVEGQTWDDIIRVMTSATVRFELLSTVHTSPVTLDVQREGGVSTKGPRGGVFVMYNCARLHTLFDSYERGVEKGLYPEIPEGSQLDFSALKEEGEWLLLFNYLITFSELLDQSGQALDCEGGGARVNIKTEQICKFLVSLSKDFSSYYNRVHVLGEPLPHLQPDVLLKCGFAWVSLALCSSGSGSYITQSVCLASGGQNPRALPPPCCETFCPLLFLSDNKTSSCIL
ncbi:DALR anticodon-binding domain-containing protein 3 [Collichthys lucidus]|uniref:DALR anticodon-binding domain-containing protein 3 n=1 Tax=Collichthys lucidus TaxID=240159 RepID=A0A4U5UUC6_COLLU|nr:DALR anticodon-binding domain-containing protein 3 [Collichthys lucidus]